jgi:hypothetical protein
MKVPCGYLGESNASAPWWDGGEIKLLFKTSFIISR